MPVVKKQAAERITKDAIVLDLADIAQQAEALRRAAKQQAEQIIAEAQAERDRLISDARDVGFNEGHERGLAEGREAGKVAGETAARAAHAEELRSLQAGWAAALEEFFSQRDHLVIECKQDVLRLALTLAERVTHRCIETDDEVVCRQIEEALRIVAKPTRVTVAVHPDEMSLARDVLPDLVGRIEGVEHAELVGDETLSPGSCHIRTAGGGEVDASIDSQLERIVDMIMPGEMLKPRISTPEPEGESPPPASDETDLPDADVVSGDPDESRGDLAA